jgi:hypothetical protein
MNTRKTVISSVLAADFGIEDFQSGAVMRGSEDIHTYDLSNKLGLLAPLADRNDTEVVTFGSEAYNLLGEAKQLEQYATQQITAANQRFAIAAEIKKGYGVEGFDSFAFGCEGFSETMTKAFTAVVAAIKKVIQSITNWIRQVMNWVGSQFAKTQIKTYETYKNKVDELKKSSVTLKVARPAANMKDGSPAFDGVLKGIGINIKNFRLGNEAAMKSLTSPGSAPDYASIQNMKSTFDKSNGWTTYYGKKLDVVKLGSASKVANLMWWGIEKPVKVNMTLATFMQNVDFAILSKDSLKNANESVKVGKILIKELNTTLKTANSLAGQLGKLGKSINSNSGLDKAGVKEANKQTKDDVKKARAAVSMISKNQRLGSLYAGILYGVFANFLKTRSYMNSLVKASAKGVKEPTSQRGKDKQARKNIGEAFINGEI